MEINNEYLEKASFNSNHSSKLDKPLTVEEFKNIFSITDEEYIKQFNISCTNEDNTANIFFFDSEDNMIATELSDDNLITHIMLV